MALVVARRRGGTTLQRKLFEPLKMSSPWRDFSLVWYNFLRGTHMPQFLVHRGGCSPAEGAERELERATRMEKFAQAVSSAYSRETGEEAGRELVDHHGRVVEWRRREYASALNNAANFDARIGVLRREKHECQNHIAQVRGGSRDILESMKP